MSTTTMVAAPASNSAVVWVAVYPIDFLHCYRGTTRDAIRRVPKRVKVSFIDLC